MAKPKKTKEQKLEEKQNDIESKKGLSKLQLLDIAVAKIEKDFGKGTIASAGELRGGDEDYISSGSIQLNLKLTGTPHRGYARGTIVEIYGWESSGKSSLAESAAGLVQQAGGIVAYIDAEHALDPEYAKKLGFDTDKAVICQPDDGEQGLNVAKELCESNAVDLIIIDSVATLVPKAEMEGHIGDQFMGLQARMMSQALRELTPAVSKSKTVVIFINQMRMKIGVMFGSPETTAGGNALKFYASQRLEIRRGDTFGPNYSTVAKDEDDFAGIFVKVKVVKNKIAPPFKKCEVPLLFESGIDNIYELLELGVLYDLIGKAGSWYSYDGEKIAQGKTQAINFLKQNPKIGEEVINAIKTTDLTSLAPPIPQIEQAEENTQQDDF